MSILPESEGEPAHVTGKATLPEVDHALEVVFRQIFLVCGTVIFHLRRHPVPTEKHVTVVCVKVSSNHSNTHKLQPSTGTGTRNSRVCESVL